MHRNNIIYNLKIHITWRMISKIIIKMRKSKTLIMKIENKIKMKLKIIIKMRLRIIFKTRLKIIFKMTLKPKLLIKLIIRRRKK